MMKPHQWNRKLSHVIANMHRLLKCAPDSRKEHSDPIRVLMVELITCPLTLYAHILPLPLHLHWLPTCTDSKWNDNSQYGTASVSELLNWNRKLSHVIANTHSQYTTASPSELLSATPDVDVLGRHPRWRSILHEWCGIDTNSMSDVISNTQV